MKVLFAGGGTGGHINPALAIAKYVQSQQDAQVLFVGTKRGMETTLVPKAGYEIEYIDVRGFRRSLSMKNITAAAKAWLACQHSKKIIQKFRPDIVVGTGGYVSGPVLLMAAKKGIPTLIHEQNVFAGMTSKMLSSHVDTVCISFEESRSRFDKAKNIIHTGNPIREELLGLTRSQAREQLGIPQNQLFIVAFGGSGGADRFNQAVVELMTSWKDRQNCGILLGTGERQYPLVQQQRKLGGVTNKNFTCVPYIDNMAQVMMAADLAVARAGAITISELAALGKPAVLIPSPNVTDNHQEYNARMQEGAGAAVVLTEAELEHTKLSHVVTQLTDDRAKLDRMAHCAKQLGIYDATARIYQEMQRLIEIKKDKKNG